jgi:segregation and condensation protein A
MLEKALPWWRKALHFAMDSLRSGFGLFSRPAHPEPHDEQQDSTSSEESPEEALTSNPPNPETLAAELTLVPEPVAAVEPAPAAEPVSAPTIASAEPVVKAPVVETAVEPEPIIAPVSSAAEPVAIAETEPVVEPVPAIVEEPAAVEPAPAEPVPSEESISSEEPVPEPDVDPIETHVEAPELASAPEPAPEEEAAVESDPETILAPVIDEISPVAELPAESVAEPEPAIEPIAAIAEEPEPPAAPAIAEELAVVEPTPAETVSSSEPVLALEIDSNEPSADEPELVSAPEPAPEEELAVEQVTVVDPEPESVLVVAEEPAAVEPAPAEPVPSTEPISSVEPVPETVVDPIEQSVEAPELASVSASAPEEGNAVEPETDDAPIPEPAPAIEAAAVIEPVPVAVPEPPAAPVPEPQPDPRLPIKTRDDAADLSPFSVIVSQVYDGPLDLLLDLIRKQDIDIYDIPIARITAQFLAYVNQLKATDVDVAGEFIYIASLLIHIKSKMLLPRAAAGPDDAAEDPRRELVERLLEHERFKNAAQMLQQKQMLEAASWTNPGIREFKNDAAAEPEIAADTVDLVRIFRDILERARKRPIFDVDEDAVTVGQMMQFLARRLTMEDKPIALRRLLSHTRSERALVAMFLALLELVRLQAVLLRQDKAFSEIFIKKHTAFDAVMNEGLANAPSDEWR